MPFAGFDHIHTSNNRSASDDPAAHENFFESAYDNFRYSLIQAPLTGVSQIVDHVFSTNLENHVQFWKAPELQSAGSAGWFGQQLGTMTGSALPFVALYRLAGPGSATKLEMTADYGLGSTKAISPILKSVAAGAAFSGLSTPVSAGDKNFWITKAEQSIAGGVGFGTLTAGSIGLKSTGNRFFTNDIVAGALSAAPGAMASVDGFSLMHDHKLASVGDNLNAAGTGLIGGATMGGANILHEAVHPTSGIDGVRTLAQLSQRADGTVADNHPERFAFATGKTAPEVTPLYTATRESLHGYALPDETKEMIARSTGDLTDSFNALKDVGNQVTVYGSARLQPDTWSYQRSRLLGGLLAQDGYAMKTGGAGGIMEGVNRGAYEAGGQSIGVNLDLPHEPYGGNGYQTISLDHQNFASRKEILRQSNAFVVEDGGLGTLDEYAELMTHIQTAKAEQTPIFVYQDSWSPIHDLLSNMYKRGTISKSDFNLFRMVRSPYEIQAQLRQAHSQAPANNDSSS